MEDLPAKRQHADEPSQSRPRRLKPPVLRKQHSVHELVPLIAASNSMPAVVVDPAAFAIMSLHAHLCTDEVIGWMAGRLADTLIEIKAAFPVKALAHENGRINVEMDPEHALQVRCEIEDKGLVIVGWYHSHPTFEATPSLMDIENQVSYQDISLGHFIGGIMSPYLSAHKMEGLFTIFHVKKNSEERKRNGHHPPYAVKFSVTGAEVEKECVQQARELVKEYRGHRRFVQLEKRWKKGIKIGEKIVKALECCGYNKSQVEEIKAELI
jgi:proteasome lid subunit RPN8/RPN11